MATAMTTPLLLTIDAAAEALSVSTRTVRRMIEAGYLQPVRIGRALRFSAADLRDWVDRQTAIANTDPGVAVLGETPCQLDRQPTPAAWTRGSPPHGRPGTHTYRRPRMTHQTIPEGQATHLAELHFNLARQLRQIAHEYSLYDSRHALIMRQAGAVDELGMAWLASSTPHRAAA